MFRTGICFFFLNYYYFSLVFQFSFHFCVTNLMPVWSLCVWYHHTHNNQLFLPSMQNNHISQPDGTLDGDTLTAHWLVDDMYTFENVGFSKDVGKIKYLICADCEIGPIGWHNLDNKKCFYIALNRVKHV